MRIGSTSGLAKRVSCMFSSTSISREPLSLRRNAGARPPKIGRTEASNSPYSMTLIRTFEIFLHRLTLTSNSRPEMICLRRASAPSDRRDFGDAFNLTETSTFWLTFKFS